MFKTTTAILLTTLMTAATAAAHPKIVSATPAAGSTVAAPTNVEIHFSEKLVPAFSGVEVLMTAMPGMAMPTPSKMPVHSSVSDDGKTLVAHADQPLPTGTYRVDWHAVAADTHRVAASYTFTVQ